MANPKQKEEDEESEDTEESEEEQGSRNEAEAEAEEQEEEAEDEEEKKSEEQPSEGLPPDWGKLLHHQYNLVSTQVECGLRSLQRMVTHLEKVTLLHDGLAKARKAAMVAPLKPSEDIDLARDFLAAYGIASEMHLNATESLCAFSLAVNDQVRVPAQKLILQATKTKQELDLQMKKRDETHAKMSATLAKDLKVCQQELALLIQASNEHKAVQGKKFSELTPEQQKVFNKLDDKKMKARTKAVKLMKDYQIAFEKARQAQEERNNYAVYALNTLRNLERERLESSTIYMFRMDEFYATLIADLQKLSLTSNIAALDTNRSLNDFTRQWQVLGQAPELTLFDYGLPCSPEEADKDIFESAFREEINKTRFAKEDVKEVPCEAVTDSGAILQGYQNVLLANRLGRRKEKYDSSRDELGLRKNAVVAAMLTKAGNNVPFLEQVHLSVSMIKINDRGKRLRRVLMLTDKALYVLSVDKLELSRRIGYETCSSLTVSTTSNEMRFQQKNSKGGDFHCASQKQELIVETFKVLLSEHFSDKPELAMQLKKHQLVFYVDNRSLLKFKQNQGLAQAKLQLDAPAKVMTAGDEAALQFSGVDKGISIRDFEASGLLGQGTFGRVLLVTKKDDPKQYALKILNKKFLLDNDQVKNIKNEQKILTSMDHPFIVKAYYTFVGNDHLYMVLDYVGGGELYNHIKKNTKFEEDVARFIIAEVALALGHLHSCGIIYRDLKPENVLIDFDGHIKITDFGTSKEVPAGTRTHTFCGTPQYLAPEVVLGYGHDRGVDWWALGILLYELTVGAAPFSDNNVKKLHDKIQNGVLKFPSAMSQSCRDLIVGLLNRSPKHRLGSADDLEEVKKHEFFKGLDWDKLLKREIAPLFVPPAITPSKLTKAQIKEFRDEASFSLFGNAGKKKHIVDAHFSGFAFTAEDPARSAPLDDAEGAGVEPKKSGDGSKKGAPPPPPAVTSDSKKAADGKKGNIPSSPSFIATEKGDMKSPDKSDDKAKKVAEKAAAEKVAAEKAAAEKAAAEKVAAEKVAAEKVAAEKAAANRAAAQKAEKAAAEKAAAKAAEEAAAAAAKIAAAEAEMAAAERALAEVVARKKKAAEKQAEEKETVAVKEQTWEVVNKGGLRIRAEPDASAKECGVLPYLQTVVVTTKKGDWVRHSLGWCLTKTGGKTLMQIKEDDVDG